MFRKIHAFLQSLGPSIGVTCALLALAILPFGMLLYLMAHEVASHLSR